MKQNRLIILVLVGIVVVVGVVIIINQSQLQDGSEPVLVDDGGLEAVDTQIPPTNTVEIADNSSETAAENPPTATIPPTPRAELVGTDPSTVNLASGDVQLVELFAFW